MDHLSDSIAELRQGGKDRYTVWQGIPMENWTMEESEPVIVFSILIRAVEGPPIWEIAAQSV